MQRNESEIGTGISSQLSSSLEVQKNNLSGQEIKTAKTALDILKELPSPTNVRWLE